MKLKSQKRANMEASPEVHALLEVSDKLMTWMRSEDTISPSVMPEVTQAHYANEVSEVNAFLPEAEANLKSVAISMPDHALLHHRLVIPNVASRDTLIEMQLEAAWPQFESSQVDWVIENKTVSGEQSSDHVVWAVACQQDVFRALKQLKTVAAVDDASIQLYAESFLLTAGLSNIWEEQGEKPSLIIYLADGIVTVLTYTGQFVEFIAHLPILSLKTLPMQLSREKHLIAEHLDQAHLICDMQADFDVEDILARSCQTLGLNQGVCVRCDQRSGRQRSELLWRGLAHMSPRRLARDEATADTQIVTSRFAPGRNGLILALCLIAIFFYFELNRREGELIRLNASMSALTDQSSNGRSQAMLNRLAQHYMKAKAGPMDILSAIAEAGKTEDGQSPFTLMQVIYESNKQVTFKLQYKDPGEVPAYLERLAASPVLLEIRPVVTRPIKKGVDGRAAYEMEIQAKPGRKPVLKAPVLTKQLDVTRKDKSHADEKSKVKREEKASDMEKKKVLTARHPEEN